MRSGMLVGLLLGLAACPPPAPPTRLPPVSTGKVRVRVFTEPSPVKQVLAAEKFVFVATEHGLERFDDGGRVFAVSSNGIAGTEVLALGADEERRAMWILTDGGLGRYDAATEVFTEVLEPPASVGLDFAALAKDEGGASIAAAKDGGAWIGTAKGLVYVSSQGGWLATPIKDPIRAVARDRGDWLWIATANGMLARKPTGETVRIGTAQGFSIAGVRLLVELPGDRMMVIGVDDAGKERVAFGKGMAWSTYRALPDVKWDAATRSGDGAVVMGGGRVYRISPHDESRVRPLARDGMRLVAVGGGAPAEWVIDPLDLVVPPGATSLGALGDQLLIGTRELGTARYREGDAQPNWLRRKQMFQDAATLSVACTRVDDCWVATGAQKAWNWKGDKFVEGGPDQVVVAVARDPNSGAIYALHRDANERALAVSKLDKGGTWSELPNLTITTPGGAPEVSFARFAQGALWVGLRYRDGLERRAFGLAVADLGTGRVAYHRTGENGTTTAPSSIEKQKMFPIPISVLDGDVRGEAAWFATSEGVAQLADGEVKVWTEADGLQSELARAVTIAGNGHVIVATGAGAAIWDGKDWAFPAALRFELNDVVATRNGQVWMATERGIAAWDGKKVRRVDTLRGLAENQILDVAVDQFDRVWARGPGSLTLISQ
ncbi:MAG: hypothetical protein SFX73_10715 [Kofleriaceae bacterium]|nr:hypothetical protein [Kofleriaceae bacterium]